MLRQPDGLRGNEFRTERHRNLTRDVVLQREQITYIAVEPLRPQMCVSCGIDQLRVDADLVARSTDTPFEYIAHAKLAADLLRVDRLVPISESGIA